MRVHQLPRLAERAHHRLEAGERPERRRAIPLLLQRIREDLLTQPDRVRGRHRTEEGRSDREVEALCLRAGVACATCVLDRSLQCIHGRRRPTVEPRCPGKELPRLRKQAVVSNPLERLDQGLRLAGDLLRHLRVGQQPQTEPNDLRARLQHVVPGRRGGLDDLLEHGLGPVELTRLAQRLAEIGQQLHSSCRTRLEEISPRQQPHGRMEVAALVRSTPAAPRRVAARRAKAALGVDGTSSAARYAYACPRW